MAEEFSYSTDIAPMQSRFVTGIRGSRNLSSRDKQRIVGGFLDNQLAQAQELAKIEDMRNTARMREIQYKSSLMSLEEQKRKAAEEKEIYTTFLPDLNSKLQEALGEPDREKRIGMLSRIGVDYAMPIAKNPVAEQAFRAASYGANTGTPARPSMTIGDMIRNGATADDLKGVDLTDLEKAAPAASALQFNQRRLTALNNKEAEDKRSVAAAKEAARIQKASDTQYNELQKVLADPYADVKTFAKPWISTFGSEEEQKRFKELSDEIASADTKDTTTLLQKKEDMKKLIAEASRRFNPALPKTTTTSGPSLWD
jgi:hypothetical protein